MTDLSKITTAEMIDDYFASLMDFKTCTRLAAAGENARLTERIEGNRSIMQIIKAELMRRGEWNLPDP